MAFDSPGKTQRENSPFWQDFFKNQRVLLLKKF